MTAPADPELTVAAGAAVSSGDGWREEAVVFPGGGGRQLAGILSRPASDSAPGAGCCPAVLVIHGWGTGRCGPHRMLVELCRELARAGHAALRFDLAGRGDSPGDYWTLDLDDMIGDTLAAGEFLLARGGAATLAAAGLCSGANVALGAAALDARIAAVSALSALPFQRQRGAGQAAARAGGTLRELLRRALNADTWRRALRGEVALGAILRRLFLGEGGRSARAAAAPAGEGASRCAAPRNLKDSRRDIQAELAAYAGRLLFVHGSLDAEGLSGWSGVFEPFLSSHGRDCRHVTIPDADHDYHSLEAKRRAIAEVLSFLAGGGAGS